MGLLDPARLGSGILCTPLDHHVDCPIAINDYGDSDDDDDDVEDVEDDEDDEVDEDDDELL